jgi:hypothetical protein
MNEQVERYFRGTMGLRKTPFLSIIYKQNR